MSISYRARSLAIASLIFVALCLFSWLVARFETERREHHLRDQVGQQVLVVMSALQAELNANVFLANGMAAHVVVQDGGINDDDQGMLHALHEYGRNIRNIGLAPGNRIATIYPLEGNEAAIGLYYPDIPSQWPAVQKAIERRATTMAGPIKLRQGGTGLISRTPVFLSDGSYWGVISLVLDVPGLLASANLSEEINGIAFAVRGTDGLGANGAVFFGDAGLFGQDSVVLDVPIPGGLWQVAARPLAGWQGQGIARYYLIAGIGLSFLLSVLAHILLHSRLRLMESERQTAALINASMDPACLVTPKGEIVTSNQAMAERFGQSLEAFLGSNIFDHMPESVRERRRNFVHNVAVTHQTHLFSDQRDGMHLEHSVYPVENAEGQVTHVGIYSRDVTSHVILQQHYKSQMLQLDTILSCSSIGIALVRDRVLVWCNEAMAQLFGYTVDEMCGHNTSVFYPSEDEYQQLGKQAYAELAKGERYAFERLMKHKDGRLFWARMMGKQLSQDDPADGSIWTFEDVTARKATEAELSLAANVFHQANQAIMVTDVDGTILSVNESFTRITGYSRGEILGLTPRVLKSKHQDAAFYARFWNCLRDDGHYEGELWNRRKSGEVFLAWQNISAVRDADGAIIRYVSLFSDVTETRAEDQRLRHLASHDALTDLPNRVLLNDRLDHALGLVGRNNAQLAVLFLDLDGFKKVNDTLGHDCGDELLREIARRLLDTVRACDTVSRLGGDEFVVLLENPTDRAEVERVANRIIAEINRPIPLNGVNTHVGTSVGIALYGENGISAEALLAHADSAMYAAKKGGKNTFRFDKAA
ncbi:MAG: diguanylate cyclase [Magnetospirillum sp.]